MSDNWVVQNLQNALGTWNDKLAEVFILIQLCHENNENRIQQQQHPIGHRKSKCVLTPPFITGTDAGTQCRK